MPTQVWQAFNANTPQTGAAIWTPAAGKKIAITSLTIGTSGSVAARCILWFSAAGVTTYVPGTSQLLLAESFAPSTNGYPGLIFCPRPPIFAAVADNLLRITTDFGLGIDVIAYGYEF